MKKLAFIFFQILHLMDEPVSIDMLYLLLMKFTIQNEGYDGNIHKLARTCKKKIYDIRSVLEGLKLVTKKSKKIVMLLTSSRKA